MLYKVNARTSARMAVQFADREQYLVPEGCA